MPDVQEVFRMATQKVRPEHGFIDRQQDRQRRRARDRKLGALALVAALGIAAAVFAIRLTGGEERSQFAGRPSRSPEAVVTDSDYVVDLATGGTTPLPETITGAENVLGSYAISPDG